MSIPESQLDTWSHQGAIKTSSSTYQSIKAVLEARDTPYAGKNYDVFLQGSYGNDTNIYAESDVDVVIKLNDCYGSDLSKLSEAEKTAWRQVSSDATYTHDNFKNDILKVLKDSFGKDVTSGSKAIMIAQNGSRRKADVITAIQYRRYSKFQDLQNQLYVEGICFYNKAGELIANYPKLHSENLTKKHQASNGWLKPMIRIVKNLRSKLIADGVLEAGIAPSYYLEGLLYNVPSDKFTKNHQTCFVNAFKWIQEQKEAGKSKFVCANEQHYLLRENSHTCWPKDDCEAFMTAAINLWNDR